MWTQRRAVAARGLAPGAASPPFSLLELAAALCDLSRASACVYVTSDGTARLTSRAGAAHAAAGATLAPHGLACNALLVLDDDTESDSLRLRLRVTSALPPHAELLLWLDEPLLARVDMPVLTPNNIHEATGYVCGRGCGARFDQPNPLKLHMWLSCAPPLPAAFWRLLLARLAAPAAPAAAPSAFRPYASPPALEALAAAWARAHGGAPGGHVCLYCGKVYSRRYGLKIHVRTHTGYKPLRCRHCARAFGDPSNLNKHLRLHAGAAAGGRYACERCGAALARRRDLERHVRARHCGPAAPAC